MANVMKNDELGTTRLRESVKEFTAERFGKPFDKLNEKQQSMGLGYFYVERVHNVGGSFISEEDLQSGWVDGAHDLGADFIHRDDGSVLVLQIKYGSHGKKARHEDLTHFQNVLLRLHDLHFRNNKRLAEAVADIDWDKDQFVLKYVWLGDLTDEGRKLTNLPPALPNVPGLLDRVEISFLDESDLRAEFREALSIGQATTAPAELFPAGPRGKAKADRILRVDDQGQFPSYVLVAEANQLTDLYGRDKEALFALNIRNYLGDTGTNRQILRTAKEKPEVFFHLNNGISCLVKKAAVDAQKGCLQVEGLQIVNGAQTVKSLYKARSSWASRAAPLLLVRVTEIGQDRQLKDEIVRANNTQNVIRDSDFRSNDPIQQDLVRRFAETTRGGKKVVYTPKRTDKIPPNSLSIRLEEFAKVIYSFLKSPVPFSGTTSFLFDTSEKGGYKDVFGDGKQVLESFNKGEFRLRSGLWWLGWEFGERIKQDRGNVESWLRLSPAEKADPEKRSEATNVARNALERKWWVFYAANLFLRRAFDEDWTVPVVKHYQGDWSLGDGPVGDWFLDLYQKSRDAVVMCYEQARKQADFGHRNWMRSTNTSDSLESAILKGPIDKFPPVP